MGYLLGLVHGLNHPNPSIEYALEGALRDLEKAGVPDDARERLRQQVEEAMIRRAYTGGSKV